MARICSRYGRVILVQKGWGCHVEIWEAGSRINQTTVLIGWWPRMEDILFGLAQTIRSIREAIRYRNGGCYDVVVGSAYENSNAALLLRQFGVAKRVIALACDYLPPENVPWHIRCHRRITGWLTANSLRRADAVWLVSPRIPTPGRNDALVMPLFINEFKSAPKRKKAVAYVGFPTPEHGLEELFEISARQGIEVHVFGDSPYLRSLARSTDLIQLHGVVTDRARLHELIKDCYCGYAIYKGVHPGSFLYYGVWSKIYTYLASKLPVVTTAGTYTSDVVREHNIGKVVQPVTADIEQALLELWTDHEGYQLRVENFVPEWNRRAENFWSTQLGALALPDEEISRLRP